MTIKLPEKTNSSKIILTSFEDLHLLMDPAFSSIPKIVDFAEVNQWRSLEESCQYLENVD